MDRNENALKLRRLQRLSHSSCVQQNAELKRCEAEEVRKRVPGALA